MNNRGFYRVGNKIFDNKMFALLHSKSTGEQVHWNFFNEKFSKVNWTQPKRIPLKQIYKERALQLRNKYDYLVLHFSAGSDSLNVLQTFLENNIKIDEVFTRWPIRLSENEPLNNSKDPKNYLNEWNLTIKPTLVNLKLKYPNLNIVTKDTSDDFYNKLWTSGDKDNMLIESGGQHIGTYGLNAVSIFSDSELDFINGGKNVGSIFGIGKPMLHRVNNSIFTYFTDVQISDGGYRKNIEPFYWSHEMPQVVVEQVHVIMDYIRANKNLLKVVDLCKRFDNEWYDEMVKTMIYPGWDRNTFQVNKAIGFDNPWTNFLYRNDEMKPALEKFKSSLSDVLQNINSQNIVFVNGEPRAIRAFESPMYYLGDV